MTAGESSSSSVEDYLALVQQSVEDGWDAFLTHYSALQPVLDMASAIHPGVGLAISVFRALIGMELTRRSNDRTVLTLVASMGHLLAIAGTTTPLKDSDKENPHMKHSLETVFNEITAVTQSCSEFCLALTSKPTVVKFFRCHQIEKKLKDFVATFAKHQSQLQALLVGSIAANVDNMQNKLDEVLALLRTPYQKAALSFSEQHASTDIYKDQTAFQQLLIQSGDTSAMLKEKDEVLAELDVGRSIDESLRQDSSHFEVLLQIVSKTIKDTMDRQAEYVIARRDIKVTQSSDMINHPDAREAWRQLKGKMFVKASNIITAFREMYEQQYAELFLPASSSEDRKSSVTSGIAKSEGWTLGYINVKTSPTLLTALDPNMSSFVTITEMNNFIAECPKQWSVPHWLAFWATGVPLTLQYYSEHLLEKVDLLLSRPRLGEGSDKKFIALWALHVHQSIAGLKLQPFMQKPFDQGLFGRRFLDHVAKSRSNPYSEASMVETLSRICWRIDSLGTVTSLIGSWQNDHNLVLLMYLLSDRIAKVLENRGHTYYRELEPLANSVNVVMAAMRARLSDISDQCARDGLQDATKRMGSGLFYYLNRPLKFHRSDEGHRLRLQVQDNSRASAIRSRSFTDISVPPTPGSLRTGSSSREPLERSSDLRSWVGLLQPWNGTTDSEFSDDWTTRPVSTLGHMDLKITSTEVQGMCFALEGEYTLVGSIENTKVSFTSTFRGYNTAREKRRYEGTLNLEKTMITGLYYESEATGSGSLAVIPPADNAPQAATGAFRLSLRLEETIPISHLHRKTSYISPGEDAVDLHISDQAVRYLELCGGLRPFPDLPSVEQVNSKLDIEATSGQDTFDYFRHCWDILSRRVRATTIPRYFCGVHECPNESIDGRSYHLLCLECSTLDETERCKSCTTTGSFICSCQGGRSTKRTTIQIRRQLGPREIEETDLRALEISIPGSTALSGSLYLKEEDSSKPSHCFQCPENLFESRSQWWRCVDCNTPIGICDKCNDRDMPLSMITADPSPMMSLPIGRSAQHLWSHSLVCKIEEAPKPLKRSGGVSIVPRGQKRPGSSHESSSRPRKLAYLGPSSSQMFE